MKKIYTRAAILAAFTFFTQNTFSQVTVSQDNASNYTTQTWGVWGSQGGTGFVPWQLWVSGANPEQGDHVIDSAVDHNFGDVDTNGSAFGIYGTGASEAVVYRFFKDTGAALTTGSNDSRAPLLPGQSFSIDIAVEWRNGYKGFDLLTTNGVFLWNFGVNNDTYHWEDLYYFNNIYIPGSVFHVTAYQLQNNTFKVKLTRGTEVWESDVLTGTLGGFKFYCGNATSDNVLNRLYFNNLAITQCPEETVWDGNTWSNGLPEIYKRVIIQADYTPAGSISACSLTVENGANVVITQGNTLTVNTTVDVATGATLTVNNNAALVQIDKTAQNNGTVTIKRDSNPLYRLDYTLWGAPVYGQQLLDFSPLTATSPVRFYTYGLIGTTTQEGYSATDYTQDFAPGTGYLIRMPNNMPDVEGYNPGTATHVVNGKFTGGLVNGTVEVAVNNLPGHYIAVANPYASPISVAQFFAANSNVIQQGNGIYFWRKRNNANNSSYGHLTLAGYTANNAPGGDVGDENYYTVIEPEEGEEATFNENWIISPGQGFLVKIKADAASTDKVVFTNTMRRPAASAQSGQPFFRTMNNQNTPAVSRWKLNMAGNGTFAQTLVAYLPQGTTGLDYGYDAQAFVDGNTRMYSKADALNLAIQARPGFINTDVVPVGFTVAAAGQYTLSLDQLDGVFAQEQDIYLKDNLLGTVSNLKTAGYTFTSAAGTFDSRFEVVYQAEGQLGANTPDAANSVVVYQNNGIYITSGNIEMTGITLLDVNGRTLYTQTVNGTQASVTGLSIAHQVLIVQVETANGKVSRKIVY